MVDEPLLDHGIAAGPAHTELDKDDELDFYRDCVANLPYGFAAFDENHCLSVWNRLYVESLDFPKDLCVQGKSLEELARFNASRGFYGSGDIEELVTERLAIAKSGRNVNFEFHRPDGHIIDARTTVFPSGRSSTICYDITERVRRENSLNDLVNGSIQGICLLDENRKPLFANQKIADLLRFKSIDAFMRLRSIDEIIAPEDLRMVMARRAERQRERDDGKPQVYEHRALCRDGSVIWVQVIAQDTVWNGQKAVQVAIIDVTERKLAETALQDTEKRFVDFAEATSDWFWELDDELRFNFVSPGFSQLTNKSDVEVLGKTPWEAAGVSPDMPGWQEHRALLKSRKPFRRFVHLFNQEDGSRRYTSASGLPIFDRDDNFLGYRGTTVDVTAEILAEEQARDAREQLFAAIEAVPVGFALYDDADRLTHCNQMYRNLSGAADVLHEGTTFEQIVRDCIGKGIVEEARHDPEKWIARRLKSHRNPGKPIELEREGRIIQITELQTPDGGILILIADTTDQRKTEEQLRQAQKMEAVGQLTGGIAHDFNNLLAVIMGNIEIIEDGLPVDSEAAIAARQALKSATSGADLTHRLLAFSRRQVLMPRRTDLGELAAETLQLLSRTLGETIQTSLTRHGDLWGCQIDPSEMQNALINLAINARDAIGTYGKIEITVSNHVFEEDFDSGRDMITRGEYVRLTVSDNGCGMPDEVLYQVFDPFFTTKEVGKGSGLGLSMVYGFISQSDGFIDIDSRVDEGTDFHLYLPRDRRVSDVEQAEPRQFPAKGEKLLIVEDDAELLSLLTTYLPRLGYLVETASSGPEALELLENGPAIDLLLTDIVLPNDMNGRVLAGEVRKRQPDIKVIYMSGHDNEVLADQDNLSGIDAFMQKPFRRTDLAQTLREALD